MAFWCSSGCLAGFKNTTGRDKSGKRNALQFKRWGNDYFTSHQRKTTTWKAAASIARYHIHPCSTEAFSPTVNIGTLQERAVLCGKTNGSNALLEPFSPLHVTGWCCGCVG
jgi:hypothetical protein